MIEPPEAGGKRGRGRPRGTTAARWKVRAAILDARAAANLKNEPAPTAAEIGEILRPNGFNSEEDKANVERTIRDERAALERHEPPDPTEPFTGFFDLPMAHDASDFERRDRKAAEHRDLKRLKAAQRRAAERKRRAEKE